MKKFLAIVLALAMVLALGVTAFADDEMAVAMITDYGDITDQSFNQTTYEACKDYCEANGIDFQYYKPASDSDGDRITSIEDAIDDGYNVIVMPGYAFGPAVEKIVPEYPEVIFVALDVSAFDIGSLAENVPANLYCAVYQEELCGYMAGYAAVKLGYTQLGFLGGMAVPAVVRYGYGFVQGADAAATEIGADISIKYVYGNQFYGDADIAAYMDTWYAAGTEIVFACGGGIFTSAADAAAKAGGKVIGVDVDQAATIDAYAATEGITVTSAMKGLAATVKSTLAAIADGSFEGGQVATLGLVSEVPAENYVQIAESTQFDDNFTVADYEALVAAMLAGDVVVSNATDVAPEVACVVDYQGNIK